MKIQNSKFNLSGQEIQNFESRSGFTILELIISMGVFLVAISVVTGIFIQSLRTQRAMTDLISINNNAGLIIEQMAREMRTGYNFSSLPGEIDFVNSSGVAVIYKLNTATGALEKSDDGGVSFIAITSDNIKLSHFDVVLQGASPTDGWPPRITISMGVGASNNYLQGVVTEIQTTISARRLDG